MENQKPSIGRIVHFNDHQGMCRAAIITGVHEDEIIDVSFFIPGEKGAEEATRLYHHEKDKDKNFINWHWPERI